MTDNKFKKLKEIIESGQVNPTIFKIYPISN